MAKKIRVWDGTQWQDVAPALPYTAVHSAQASMPSTGVDGQIWLDTDGTLSDTQFVPLAGGTMTGNLNVPSINSGPIVGRNKIINGDFGVWQRGTSFSIPSNSNTFCADRWQIQSQGGTAVASQQVFSPASIAGLETQYYLRIVQSAGTANTLIINRIEDVRTLANQNITVSYWAKASATTTITTRYDQDFGTGGSSRAANGGSSSTITTSWTRYSSTFTVASISGKTLGLNSYIEFFLYYPNTSGITVELAGVQLEAGNQATPFHTATPNQQTELAACQRYYEKSYLDTVAPGTASDGFIINGFTQTSGQKCMMGWRWTVRKRSTPTVTIYDRAGNSGKLTVVDIGGTPTDNQAIALISSDYNGLNYLGANNGTHTGFRFNWVADAEL